MNTENRLLLRITTLVVVVIAIISIFGIILYRDSPEILQGEIDCTRIKISGKLLGRVEKLYVQEGYEICAGDTLVKINSPETDAVLQSANSMKEVASYRNREVDAGARSQTIASLFEIWNAAKAEADVATATNARIEKLYADSVVTLQRKEESNAIAQAAVSAEKAARYQYEMALEGAREEEKGAARALVSAAQGNVDEVGALLKDSHLTSPSNGIVSEIFPTEGELVLPGSSIMEIIVPQSNHVVLNIREDMLHKFLEGSKFTGQIPALNYTEMEFEVYSTSPLGSYATWQSSRENAQYNLVTFKVKGRPAKGDTLASALRPGMSVIIKCN